MSKPISPAPVAGGGRDELPPYLSNGVIGLRVREQPLRAGMTLVSGYTGEHPQRRIEASAVAPYPLAADIRLAGVWLSDAPQQVRIEDQSYDFATGELTSRFAFEAGGVRARVEVLTFCLRSQPTIVCQEIRVETGGPADIELKAVLDARESDGQAIRALRAPPNVPPETCEGSLLWESGGAYATVGLAYLSLLQGAEAAAERPRFADHTLFTTHAFRAQSGRSYRLRQIAAVVPSVLHLQPDFEAVRQVALAGRRGFHGLREDNRAIWADIWQGRIFIDATSDRWQALADAAFFYMMSSTHASSPASTSIFGLATWKNYHYYYGHVMWDIEAFAAPVLSMLQPRAARSVLDYRSRFLASARANARLRGQLGVRFPWEAAGSTGEEATPMPGEAPWREEHVSLDVARAFAFHADATGDVVFLREQAWPVLSGVAAWIIDRVTRTDRGFEFKASMGIAERQVPVDNPAFTAMAAIMTLKAATAAARRLGIEADPEWESVASGIALATRGLAIVSHDGWRSNEEKGATPDPLMGVFPLGYPMAPEVETATLATGLDLADDYIGSPMLSAFYGVWAARAGDRAMSARLLDAGYARFSHGRFLQTLEYRPDRFPEQPRAGPFFANLGGFLMSLLLGFPGLEVGSGDPGGWPRRSVILPRGFRSITAERLWLRGRPWRLEAPQGARFARLTQA
jgi:trehalose/maltose hydrolase-like predicted phosphorylase